MIGFNTPVNLTDITLSPVTHQLAGDRYWRTTGNFHRPRLHDRGRNVGVTYSAINTNPGLMSSRYLKPFPLKYTTTSHPRDMNNMAVEPMPRPYRGGSLTIKPHFNRRKYNPIFSETVFISSYPKIKPYMALHTVPKI